MRGKWLRAERMALQAELAVLRRAFLENYRTHKPVRIGFFRSMAILAFGAGGRMMNTECAWVGPFPTFLTGEDE